MIYIGCHLSTTDGYPAMGKKITAMGGNTFAWFTRNPQGGRSNPPKPADVAALSDYAKRQALGEYEHTMTDPTKADWMLYHTTVPDNPLCLLLPQDDQRERKSVIYRDCSAVAI